MLALLVDATSVFSFQQYLKAHDYEISRNIDYGALMAALNNHFSRALSSTSTNKRKLESAESPFQLRYAAVAINPEHEGQKKFCEFLEKKGFIVDQTDFRDAFVVPNREHPYQRLSSRITYVAGMLSGNKVAGKNSSAPHLVVVTDSFDTYYPLLDYVETRGGQVTVAFFRRGMEDRWQRVGLFSESSPIQFLDLSEHAHAILGADIYSSRAIGEGGGKGLSSIKF